MSLRIKVLTEDDLPQVEEYKKEMEAAYSSMDETGGLASFDHIHEWYEKLLRYNDVKTCPSDKSPSTQYLMINAEDKLVGMIDLRHTINHPILKLYGGHIGYSVRPSERRKGYATEALHLVIQEAPKYHVDQIMISCLVDNEASRKVILANGGKFDHNVYVPESGETFSIFYIDVV